MRANNFSDLTDRRFGRLTAIGIVGTKPKTMWECACDCGERVVKSAGHLTSGFVKSCGCLRRDVAKQNMRQVSTKHGLCSGGTPRWYKIWRGMMDRCYNQNFHRFHRYGGRGITVATEWHDPEVFLADMGEPPSGGTIERIDNDAGYSPQNCTWATKLEQNNNRSDTRKLTFAGKTLSAAAWAREIGLSKAAMYQRLKTWPLEKALSTPPGG